MSSGYPAQLRMKGAGRVGGDGSCSLGAVIDHPLLDAMLDIDAHRITDRAAFRTGTDSIVD